MSFIKKYAPNWQKGLLALLVLAPLFYLTYGFANQWAASLDKVPTIMFDWEHHVELVPWTILPYWSINFFYGLSLLIAPTEQILKRHFSRLLTAQVICVVCFMLFPLKFSLVRPAIDGWEGFLFNALTSFDLPFNQAPSLHIVLLLILWDFYRRLLNGKWLWMLHIWSLLIAVSVLTTWQHHFIDIPTGVLAGLFCMWMWPLQGSSIVQAVKSKNPVNNRICLYYLLAATGSAALFIKLGSLINPVFWWFTWISFSLLLVSFAYGFGGPWVFQKSANGQQSLASRWLLAPHRMGSWVNSRVWTWRQKHCVQVTPEVYLGRYPDEEVLKSKGIGAVLDLTCELGGLKLKDNLKTIQCHPLLDLVVPESSDLLECANILKILAEKEKVLVFCALGYSRSAAVVVTWMCLTSKEMDVEKAVSQLKAIQPEIRLNSAWKSRIKKALQEAQS